MVVHRVSPEELNSAQRFVLNAYGEQFGQFTALIYQGEMYVNANLPDADLRKFLQIAESDNPYIGEPGSPEEKALDYVCKKYPAVYTMLRRYQSDRMDRLRTEEAKKRAEILLPGIRDYMLDIESDPLDPYLASALYSMGIGKGNSFGGLSYSGRLLFYLGYLTGTGTLSEIEANCVLTEGRETAFAG